MSCPDNPAELANLIVEGNLAVIDGDGTEHAYAAIQNKSVRAIPRVRSLVRCPRALQRMAHDLLGRRPDGAADRHRLQQMLTPEQMQLLAGVDRCTCGRRLRGPRRDAVGKVRLGWIDCCRCGRRSNF